MSKFYPSVDPEGLVEYSVVYTDRSLNHMSQSFQGVMKNISRTLKQVYNAEAVAVVPGSGTFGMEAVARQFATGQQCLVIRNAGSAIAGARSLRWATSRRTHGTQSPACRNGSPSGLCPPPAG